MENHYALDVEEFSTLGLGTLAKRWAQARNHAALTSEAVTQALAQQGITTNAPRLLAISIGASQHTTPTGKTPALAGIAYARLAQPIPYLLRCATPVARTSQGLDDQEFLHQLGFRHGTLEKIAQYAFHDNQAEVTLQDRYWVPAIEATWQEPENVEKIVEYLWSASAWRYDQDTCVRIDGEDNDLWHRQATYLQRLHEYVEQCHHPHSKHEWSARVIQAEQHIQRVGKMLIREGRYTREDNPRCVVHTIPRER